MSEIHTSTGDQNEPGFYEIRIKGHLDDHWAGWFEGLTLTFEETGDTLLTGLVADQAALQGLLKKVRDQRNTMISDKTVKTIKANKPDLKQKNKLSYK
jgi:hypothetical protein